MDDLARDPSHAGRIREMAGMLRSLMEEAGDPVKLDEPDWGVAG